MTDVFIEGGKRTGREGKCPVTARAQVEVL